MNKAPRIGSASLKFRFLSDEQGAQDRFCFTEVQISHG